MSLNFSYADYCKPKPKGSQPLEFCRHPGCGWPAKAPMFYDYNVSLHPSQKRLCTAAPLRKGDIYITYVDCAFHTYRVTGFFWDEMEGQLPLFEEISKKAQVT